MEIVCSTDNNYVMPTGVMLTSLFENNKGENICVHVLDGGLADESKSQLNDIANKYSQHIVYYKINDELFKDFPIDNANQACHIHSMATYYRLYMSKILPENIDKIIYLDGDLLVLDSLKSLWDMNLDGYALAAVPDPFNNRVDHYNSLRYPMELGYFNAGVLLVNLRYWRDNNVLVDFLDLIKEHPERLTSHDQDVLNYTFRNKKLTLPLKYNMMPEYLYRKEFNNMLWSFEEEISEGQKNPVIVHFTFVPKPWFKDCPNPYRKVFLEYRSKTIWSDSPNRKAIPMKKQFLNWLRNNLIDWGILTGRIKDTDMFVKISANIMK